MIKRKAYLQGKLQMHVRESSHIPLADFPYFMIHSGLHTKKLQSGQ